MSISNRHIPSRLHETEARWFALRTSHRHEKAAARLLERDGIQYFLPLLKNRKQYKRKAVTRSSCLIPGYVFVLITKAELPFLFANPYAKLLKVGSAVVDIPKKEIETLHRIVGAKQLEWELVQKNVLETGQQVELVGGHLTGVKGTYLKKHNKGFLVVTLSLLPTGMELKTTVPEHLVRPLNEKHLTSLGA